MSPVILRGTKQEIAAKLIGMPGEVSEAIVFVANPNEPSSTSPAQDEDIFAEMLPYMVDVEFVDDSREAIYTRQDGE